MHGSFANWPVGRRLIALAAAYAIALSSLIVSFGTARAAVPAPDIITCHSEAGGTTRPADGEPNGKLCDASCCIGCLMLVAALPPPPMVSVTVEQSAGRLLTPPIVIEFRSDPQTKSHQSRAPPRAA